MTDETKPCPFPTKIKHDTQLSTQTYLDSLRRLGDAKTQHIYLCPTRDHWHVGDKTKGLSRRERRRARRLTRRADAPSNERTA